MNESGSEIIVDEGKQVKIRRFGTDDTPEPMIDQ